MTRTVLVTDAGRGSAIAFIRSLGRKGWRVVAADHDARSAGFRSRYASTHFVYPAPRTAPRAFVEALRAKVAEERVDLVVPITDECIHPLAHARASFEGLTQLAIASDAALAAVADKRATIALAERLGIPVPETRAVESLAAAHAAADELGFPLVVKPAVSRRYLPAEDRIEDGHVGFAHDPADLERRVEGLLGTHALLLQRYRPGGGGGVELLVDDRDVLRAFQHRRHAEIPVTGGASARPESVALDPVLLAHARALVRDLRWTGLVMVEFKVGEKPWLIEVNGRVWGSLPLACLAGVDFPGGLAELYFPDPAATAQDDTPYALGLRAYNFELMLSWIAQVLLGRKRTADMPYPTRTRALAGLAGLLDPAQKSDLACAGDFAPRLAEAGRIVRKLRHKLVGGAA
jgi:predicted ATP-grasp superfamily ATP-dependent carboligase